MKRYVLSRVGEIHSQSMVVCCQGIYLHLVCDLLHRSYCVLTQTWCGSKSLKFILIDSNF
jgi:hypothetical protein